MTHITTTRAARTGLLAAAALLLTCAVPAQAVAGREPASDWLLLTVTQGDTRPGARPGVPGTQSGATRSALLLCDPPRGHARAARACAELDATDGRIADIPLRETHCPMIYAPVTAHAHGQWRGQPVEYTRTFPNPCVMAARTGAVFAWDTEG
ncbi:SSI family serine proteinase inhibitor [Streptomyces pactum]|uniref:Serine protease n=1 Tax=Streptomyces pactum TaxID=68249 RepID=A0A1S6J5A0_9ACTN|nr:SSI family serine proteinase inhibitor [Streptomyces pactum]AQS66926.1 serine protease [Streptomyces pactum]